MKKIFFLVCCALLLNACSPAPVSTSTPMAAATSTPFPALTLMSSAFAMGEAIPQKFTCEGENISPPLAWNEPPAQTKSFAIIMDDPDANGFVHWVLYNIPSSVRSLPEMNDSGPKLKDGLMQGANGVGGFGYMGSCPPQGPAHRYSFRLYALDTSIEQPVFDKDTLLAAMNGHILAQSEWVGTYTAKE